VYAAYTNYEDELTECSETAAHKFRHQGITQKKYTTFRTWRKFEIKNNVISFGGLYGRPKDIHYSIIQGCTHLMEGIKNTFFSKKKRYPARKNQN
jgi:hypothetical protein